MKNLILLVVLVLTAACAVGQTDHVYPMQDGFVDANGVMIYYTMMGRGEPLLILHGGPGASHDYFLPYLLPLARHHKVIFIDERGSGKSQKLEDVSAYTIENMVEDVEAVRQGLGLGKIDLLGHSYGGALAQAYALKYQGKLRHLILASTWSSSAALESGFCEMKQNMAPELRERIDRMEAQGLFGTAKTTRKIVIQRIYDCGVGRGIFSVCVSQPAGPELRSYGAGDGVGLVPRDVGRAWGVCY